MSVVFTVYTNNLNWEGLLATFSVCLISQRSLIFVDKARWVPDSPINSLTSYRWDNVVSMLCLYARHFTLTSLRCKWVTGGT